MNFLVFVIIASNINNNTCRLYLTQNLKITESLIHIGTVHLITSKHYFHRENFSYQLDESLGVQQQIFRLRERKPVLIPLLSFSRAAHIVTYIFTHTIIVTHAHTHTHTHTYTHTHIHKHTYTNSHTLTHTHADVHVQLIYTND